MDLLKPKNTQHNEDKQYIYSFYFHFSSMKRTEVQYSEVSKGKRLPIIEIWLCVLAQLFPYSPVTLFLQVYNKEIVSRQVNFCED